MEMEKAYDGKALIDALKQEGIENGLEVSKKVIAVLADFLRSSAQKSTEGLIGKLDDFAIPGINYFEKLAVEKLSELEASLLADKVVVAQQAEAAVPVDGAPKA